MVFLRTTRRVSSILSRRTAFSTSTRFMARATQDGSPDQPQAQSVSDRSANFEEAATKIGSKMQADPQAVTSEDAAYLKSREARATGQSQPPKGSISAEAQRLAAENEGDTNKTSSAGQRAPGTTSSTAQSEQDRMENSKEAEQEIGIKMDAVPEHVTKEDASLLRSRETRAFGKTEKGGAAAQAQSLAAENEKKGTI